MIIQILNQYNIEILFSSVSDDVIFTTITTISIFIIGYLLNRFNNYRKEVKRLNELEEYFYSLSEQIKNPINDQIKIFKELADDIADEKKNQFLYKDNINLDVTNLLNIQHLDLHKIFIARKKGEIKKKAGHFTNMTNTLNYLESLKINAKKNFEIYFSEFRENEGNWREAYNSIMENFDTFVSSNIRNDIQKVNDDFLNDFDTLLQEWDKYEYKNNIYLAYKNFILPLRGICKRYRGDERVNVIAQLVNSARSAFISIDYYKKTYSNRFNADASYLKSKFESFESAIKYFKGENGKSKEVNN